MRELRTLGSVRGAPSNGCPYRDRVEAGEFIDGQSVFAVGSLISISTAVWQAERVRP